jgi:hypothetical protein
MSPAERVVIGMDPHKRSATIEVMSADETNLGGGRFDTDRDGYAAMASYGRRWPNRVWAIEGCAGIGKHIATRLLANTRREMVDARQAKPGSTRSLSGRTSIRWSTDGVTQTSSLARQVLTNPALSSHYEIVKMRGSRRAWDGTAGKYSSRRDRLRVAKPVHDLRHAQLNCPTDVSLV